MRPLFAFLLAGLFAVGPTARLMPVDEAGKDADLKRTRDDLLTAVKARDAEAVMRYVSPDVITNDVSGPDGEGWMHLVHSFIDYKSNGGKEHADWIGLEAALSLGGAFTTTRGPVLGRREFCAPYVFAAFPETVPESVRGEIEPWALIRKDVELREAPDARSRLIARLSYELLQAPGSAHRDPKSDRMWQTVELPDEREAFVPGDAIWDPGGYHVCLGKIDGRWLMTSFNARGHV